MADIRVRVGQENAVKVIASVSGSAGGISIVSENVIGGIASITQLSVSGVSTFIGVSTFRNDVYIANTASIGQLNVNGVSTFKNNIYVGGDIYYTIPYPTYGMLFFGPGGLISATNSPGIGNTTTTNYVLTTNTNNIPIWSSIIDGGEY